MRGLISSGPYGAVCNIKPMIAGKGSGADFIRNGERRIFSSTFVTLKCLGVDIPWIERGTKFCPANLDATYVDGSQVAHSGQMPVELWTLQENKIIFSIRIIWFSQ